MVDGHCLQQVRVELVSAPTWDEYRRQGRTLRGHPPGAQTDPIGARELDLPVSETYRRRRRLRGSAARGSHPQDHQQSHAQVPHRQGEEDEHIAEHRSHPPGTRQLEDHLHRRQTGLFAERYVEDVTLYSVRRVLLIVDAYTLRRCDAPQLQTHLPALGYERALALTDPDGNAVVRGLAGDPAPGILTFLIAEAVSRILIECGFSLTLGRVDEQRQRVVRPLVRVGRVRPHRNGRISLYVEGGLAQGSVGQDMGWPFEALATVVVEPGTLGQVDVAVVEERVEVGEESLAKFDHLPAHRLVGLAEGPGLLTARPYRGVVAAVRLEDPEFCPAGQELSVRVAPESSHVDPGPGDA